MTDKKLCATAELWKDALFLTSLACLFFCCFGATFYEGQYTRAFMYCAALFFAAYRYLPEKIDFFFAEKEEKEEEHGF